MFGANLVRSHAIVVRAPALRGHMNKVAAPGKPAKPAEAQLDAQLPAYLEATAEGCSLAIRAKPGAKARALLITGDTVTVSINAPAREGEANKAVTQYVASVLGLKKHQVALSRASAKSREKVLSITGLTAPDVLQLLLKSAG